MTAVHLSGPAWPDGQDFAGALVAQGLSLASQDAVASLRFCGPGTTPHLSDISPATEILIFIAAFPAPQDSFATRPFSSAIEDLARRLAPARRVCGLVVPATATAEDVTGTARTVRFCIECQGLTGQTIHVTGGAAQPVTLT